MENIVEQVHCSSCLRETRHTKLFHQRTIEFTKKINNDPECWTSYGFYYDLYKCCGCENIVLKKAFWHTDIFPEDYDDSFISWYPALVHRNIPDWHTELPNDEKKLLTEIFQALYTDSKSLALMGLRAIVDMFIVRKIGDKGTFGQKLQKLGEEGFLSSLQVETLGSAINAGNAASHRAYTPSEEVLILVLNIVETLLHQDVLNARTALIDGEVPARQ